MRLVCPHEYFWSERRGAYLCRRCGKARLDDPDAPRFEAPRWPEPPPPM
jgi:hypothetical protein